MKKWSSPSMNQRSKKKFTTKWAFEEGVFETPQGKWIARIKVNNNRYNIISIHDSEKEAQIAYDAEKHKIN